MIKKGKKHFAIAIVLVMMITMLAGCGENGDGNSLGNTIENTEIQQEAQAVELPETQWQEEALSGEDVTDVMKAVITLNTDTASVEGEGVTVEGNVITITEAGEYEVSGTLNGQLVVDTESEDNVKIILNGVTITNEESAAVYVVSSPGKTILHAQKGSVNVFADGETYSNQNTDGEPNATIFAKDDLKISGSGAIYVTGNYGKGISCKDDLEIKNASVYVDAIDDAIRGKDSVEVEGAFLYLIAGGDGLRTSNETEEDEGYMILTDSECYIMACLDGIQAIGDLEITNCTMGLITAGGYTGEEVSTTTYDSNEGSLAYVSGSYTLATYVSRGPGGPGGMGGGMTGGPGGMGEGNPNEYTDSCKGIKSDGSITISGGSYTIDSYDDALHCADTMTILDGEFVISTGDDGCHSDGTLIIEGGNVNITTSYEGLEASEIYYNGGTTRIVASDDGINAAGGNDSSGMGGMWGDSFSSDGTSLVELNGGYLMMDAGGDGLDSNGDLTINGGVYIVYGPSDNGNAALDYAGTGKHNGGTLLAVGSAGMAQAIESEHGVLAFTCGMNADTILSIQDEDGNILMSFAAPKSYSCVVFATEGVKAGKTYNVYANGTYDSESVDGIYKEGSYTGGELLGSLEAN